MKLSKYLLNDGLFKENIVAWDLVLLYWSSVFFSLFHYAHLIIAFCVWEEQVKGFDNALERRYPFDVTGRC